MTDIPVVTVALPKGRLAQLTLGLFERAGVDVAAMRSDTRRLVFEVRAGDDGDAGNGAGARGADGAGDHALPSVTYRFLFVKPGDVPTYVEHGVADIGVAGKDTLLEENRPLYEMLDLGFGRCRMCVAGFPDARRRGGPLRVATKFPAIASRFYAARGEDIEIIKLGGSVELGPIVGLSDVIVDIVESGSTLRANGLAVLEDICEISARLVVNRVSLKTKGTRIQALMRALQTAMEEAARG